RDRGQVALALQHAAEAGEVGLEPVLFGVLERLIFQVTDHLVDRILERCHFARGFDRDRARQVALGHRGRHVGDRAHLVGQIGGELVHVVGEIAPQAGRTGHARLTAELAFDADLAGHVRHLVAERGKRLDHSVDRFGQRRDFALGIERQLAPQVALRDGGNDVGDAAYLVGQVVRHQVHVVGEVLPCAADARHLRLSTQLAFGADFTRHARHFGREGVQLIDHRVDGVFERKDFALHVDSDLLRQVAARHGGGHVGDVADLAGEIVRHQVHVVGEVLPGTGDAAHLRLATELAFGADFTRHAGYLGCEGVQLIDHRVDGVFELEDLAFHIDSDLFRQVAESHGGGHFSDITHLAGKVRGHRVHVVGEVLPGAADAFHLRLTAKTAFGADFAGDARHFGGERVELIDHRVDGVFELEDLALHVDGNLLRQVPTRHSGGDFGDVAHLAGEVAGHGVHVVGEVFPGAGNTFHLGLPAEP